MDKGFGFGFRLAFDVSRTKVKRSYRRRIAFRNSLIRQEVSGYTNYERIWFAGWDITIQWGVYDPKRPQWSYRNGNKKVRKINEAPVRPPAPYPK